MTAPGDGDGDDNDDDANDNDAAKAAPPLAPDDPRFALLGAPKLRGTAYHFLTRHFRLQHADAEDVLQGAYANASKELARFPTTSRAFVSFFLKAVRYDCLDHFRKEQRERDLRTSVKHTSARSVEPYQYTAREIVEFLDENVKGATDEETLEMIYASMVKSFDAVAAAHDLDPKAAYKRRERFQAHYYAFWVAAAILLGLGGWRILASHREQVPIVRDDSQPHTSPSAAASAANEARAIAIRDEAFTDCEGVQRGMCARKLVDAVKLWPPLANEPRVQAVLLEYGYRPLDDAGDTPPGGNLK